MSYINIGDFTGGEQDYWSWSHLKNFVGQDEAAEHFYAGESSTVAAYSCPVRSSKSNMILPRRPTRQFACAAPVSNKHMSTFHIYVLS